MFFARTRSPGLEARGRGRRPCERAARHDSRNGVSREFAALQRLAGTQRAASGKLVGVDQAPLDQQLLEAVQPFLVIRAGQINDRRQSLTRIARHVDVESAGRAHRAVHRHDAAFPGCVKDGLVRFLA
jgi:hypothetical protein